MKKGEKKTEENNPKNERKREKKTKNKKRKVKTKAHKIRILYNNINGVRGKIKSLTDVMEITDSDVIILTETKGEPPLINNYTWYTKNRQQGKGGGIAIAIRNEKAKYADIVKDIEQTDMEIIWVKLEIPGTKTTDFIGCYYGPQESCKKDEVERQYSIMTTQIHTLKKEGNIILAGDFNAKLEIDESNHKQKESRNGKILKELIKETNCQAVNLKSETGLWTREHRKNQKEKSTIDYILMSEKIQERIETIEVDEAGTKRMWSANTETDHNTIMLEINTRKPNNNKKTIKRWNLENEEGWKEFNKKITNRLKNNDIKKYEDFSECVRKTMRETIGQKTITIGGKKGKEDKETKTLRKEIKTTRKAFEKDKK